MSDHDAISFEVLTSLEKHKLQEKKKFQYQKADKDGILTAMAEFVKSFLNMIHATKLFKTTGNKLALLMSPRSMYLQCTKSHKDVPLL